MSFKKVKVVMLSTNEKAIISNHEFGGALSLGNGLHSTMNYNLYFLSDEEIKDGDWHYDEKDIGNEIKQWKGNLYSSRLSKKIIATTDKSLKIFSRESYLTIPITRFLPQPSNSFIEKFVEAYNSGKPIIEVMVEYNPAYIDENPMLSGFEKLKISKDNTITIKKVKDSWDREEVKELLLRYQNRLSYAGKDVWGYVTKEWIEENL